MPRYEFSDAATGGLVFLAVMISGIINAATGVGGAGLLLPLLLMILTPDKALAVVGISQIARNLMTGLTLRGETLWPIVLLLAAGGIPGAILGALLVGHLPEMILRVTLGICLLMFVASELMQTIHHLNVPTRILPGVGAASGFLSALFGTTGTFTAPFLFAHGLVGVPLVATITWAALAVNVAKVSTYATMGFIQNVGLNLALVTVMSVWIGVAIGLRILRHETPERFKTLFLIVLSLVALSYLLGGVRENPAAPTARQKVDLREVLGLKG